MQMFSSDNKNSQKRELQGPRPPALRVGKDSFKIKKPHGSHPPSRPPVIIHLKSPDIIHIKPQDFMIIVQQLTGKPSTSLAPSTKSVLSSLSASSSSSSVIAPTCGSVSKMLDDLKIKNSSDFEVDHENFGVEEQITVQTEGSHGISPSMAQSNFSPMYSGSFIPSPNVYSNWPDFGPIYYLK